MLLSNFSLQMLPPGFTGRVSIRPATQIEAIFALGAGGSGVGHAYTAQLLSRLLRMPVEVNRREVTPGPGDSVIIAQYRGLRLPEGATTLPEDAKIEFISVTRED